jgi:hypothetical protein
MVVGHVLAVAAHVSLNLRSARGIALLPLHLLRVEQRHQPATSLVLFQRKNSLCLQTFTGRIQVDCCVLRCLLVPSAFARLARQSAGRSTWIRTGSAEQGLCKSGDACYGIPGTNSVLGQTRRMHIHVAQSLVALTPCAIWQMFRNKSTQGGKPLYDCFHSGMQRAV